MTTWFYATIRDADASKAASHSVLRDHPSDPPEPPAIAWGAWKLEVGAKVLVRKRQFDLIHWRDTDRQWTENHLDYEVLFYNQHMKACRMNPAAAEIFLQTCRRNGKVIACTEKDAKWADDQIDKIMWEWSR